MAVPPELRSQSREDRSAEQERAASDDARVSGWRALTAPGSRIYDIAVRVVTGVFRDGFIHAGNLAYMTILSLFPFLIAVSAIFSVLGEQEQREASVAALLSAVPPSVSRTLGPVAYDVIEARQGWLLWVGGLVGIWTASSLVETIRDILHRAYGSEPARAFWQYRLFSAGIIFVSVFFLLVSLGLQVVLGATQELIAQLLPQLSGFVGQVLLSQVVAALVLFGSIYLIFLGLTPRRYQSRRYPKWPGALLVAVWWLVVTAVLPSVLSRFFAYDLTYGSLAGVMIALFFFWLVGLGMVVGAELNAALAVTTRDDDGSESEEESG